jgi:DNA helicase-4
VYEADYEIQTASREYRQYQPDFYLPDYGIYIEHFGINKKGETAPYVNQNKYLEQMEWKRGIHKRNQTKLIETFSYEKSEGILLSNLEQTLKRHGVSFHRIPNEEIFQKINELGIVRPFIDLLAKFLNLFKSQNLTIDEVRVKAKGYADWQRHIAFLDIFAPIYENYTSYLQKLGKIDFNDLINIATHYVTEQQFKVPYKYILVDEFQDISQSRYRLLKSLLDQAPSCKLFGVGDDWQSIYRFAGSDLSIMTHFPDYFGITEHMYLNRTFRFNNKICEFSSQFITKNRDQLPKKMFTQEMTDSPAITLVWSESATKDLLRCLTAINQLEREKTSVFIIGRYRHQKPERLRFLQNKFPRLSISYLTAHSSKGREADYVIIIGLESGRYSFPCQIQDDPVLNLVLARQDTYPNAEERRLFYVATTRAKKHVYLLADSVYPSTFINEILRDRFEIKILNDNQTLDIHCPQCKMGNIVQKDGNWGTFFSCTNYPYCDYKAPTCPACTQGFLHLNQKVYACSNEACHFKARICPLCREGYLVRRKGRRGAFMGCSIYPRCHYTESVRASLRSL